MFRRSRIDSGRYRSLLQMLKMSFVRWIRRRRRLPVRQSLISISSYRTLWLSVEKLNRRPFLILVAGASDAVCLVASIEVRNRLWPICRKAL